VNHVGTRELKQNPNAVIVRVLETGEPAAVTAHGRATGVQLAPVEPLRRRWVSGAALRAAVGEPDPAEVADMLALVDQARDGGGTFDAPAEEPA
jgi:antitoxin (DNA-binding transcriptional repressor) of toxin-antitoxin stability system